MYKVASNYVSADAVCYSSGAIGVPSNGVRPLVTLSSSKLKITGGDGTSVSSAWKLEKK